MGGISQKMWQAQARAPIIHVAITENPDPGEIMPIEVPSAFLPGVQSVLTAEEKANIDRLIEEVPDTDDVLLINYWLDIDDKKVYLEGWCDKCLAATDFPPIEGGEWDEKIRYMIKDTQRTLFEKQEERDLTLIEGGFREFEAGDRGYLYGVTWGLYSKKANISQEIANLPVYKGDAWRAESGYTHGRQDTAGDVIRFERDELGNDFGLSEELIKALDQYHASALTWVTRKREQCLWYLSKGESDECVGQLDLGPSPRIVVDTGEEGLLVLGGYSIPMSQYAQQTQTTAYGTCYQDAFRYLKEHYEDAILVHGTAQRITREGIGRTGHAWVELPDGTIWEPENKMIITREQFEISKPEVIKRYTFTAAALAVLKHSHYGPWEEEGHSVAFALRTEGKYDAMVRHLGYEPITAPEGLYKPLQKHLRTDVQLINESQKRLRNVELIPDSKLDPSSNASIALARHITSDLSRNRPVRGVHAAIIPPASDRVCTAGLYGRSTEEIFIAGDQLHRARTAVDTTIHELAHHTTGAEDGEEAHNSELSRLGGLVVKLTAQRNYDNIIGNPSFDW